MERRTWLGTIAAATATALSGVAGTPAEQSSRTHPNNRTVGFDPAPSGPAKLGLIGDSHYNEVGGRKEITSGKDIKRRWDEMIDDFNEWGATAVLSTGDLVDRKSCPDRDTYDRWTQTAMNYLERRGGSAGRGLEMPIYYTLGDHEYSYYGEGYFGPYGYDTREDSYYKVPVGSVDIVVVTDVVASSDWDTPQTVGRRQLDWLKTTLFEDSRPKVVLTHVPPFEAGTGPFGKDGVTDGDEFGRVVESCPEVVTAIYGHVHHEDAFDRHRSQRNGWMHITAPHQLMDDPSVTPYAKLTTGVNGGGLVEANYTRGDTGYPDTWGFTGDETRQKNPSPTHLSGLSIEQIAETPTDADINGGNVAVYAKPDGHIYKRAYGGDEVKIG